MANPAASAHSRNQGVDFLRAICILYVVGYWHLIPYTTALPGYANWFTEGLKYAALATFVFCSGYLLGRQAITLDPRGLWSFYRRRLLRIYPLYLLALILFGAFGIASQKQVVDGALLVSMFRPPAMPTLWFVTMIMVFYLIAPLLIRFAHRPAVTVLIGGGLLMALIVQHLWIRHLDLRILLYLPVFVLGILYQRHASLGTLAKRHEWILLGLLILLLPLSVTGNEWSLRGTFLLMPLILVSAPALFLLADRIADRLHGPTIEFLAYASFGLYLFHRLIFKAAIAVFYPATGWEQVLYLLMVALPLSLLIGYGLQRVYDGLVSRLSAGRRM
ncbi:acyltransferase family protein [Thiocystis violascens]|uniref:Putative acyltransferase n=1 Tax=Thiocystis violascens (strain ATCC 17096 / DSM 198 / 6111) TaxID=765911 RepID=I3YEK4_THIV6|nr:acyltransferase [Thiocystis violascens]AFL75422.1 putative acyltransferase [Thiocystis violascens DSM 198]